MHRGSHCWMPEGWYLILAAGLIFLLNSLPAIGALPATTDTTQLSAREFSGPLSPQLTFGGVLLAVIFAGSLVTTLAWMLAVPRPVPAVAAHARRVVSSIRRIVVPTNMHTNWERAVELACRLGEDQKAEILLTYVIEVPFTLSLGAPMGKAEAKAKEILKRATEIVEHHSLPVRSQIERARVASEGIARLARDEEADLIVMAMPALYRGSLPARSIEVLLQRAPCEVIIDSTPARLQEPEPAIPGSDDASPSE